ncbi:MAG: Ni/Fe hydrogenase subunit alpha, partial [Alphaproteobacteria bacterium]
MARRTIKADYLARVEGEAAMRIVIDGGKVEDVRLSIFEPPRFFEAFLRGRGFAEAPDITARICGICPVAYQMSAVAAMEDALAVGVAAPVRDLRRLLYCGEWIESHVLHIYMLHAPDFLGYAGAVEMARDHPDHVTRGLALKKAGNAIVRRLGGREIHPVNVRVGGFYRAPGRAEMAALAEELKPARDAALETVRWVAGFAFPELARDYEFVSLRHETEYPMMADRIVSTGGLDIAVGDYGAHFEEHQVPHSHALHATIKGRGGYLVGPMARYNLNRDKLRPLAREAADAAGLEPFCRNPFRSILVRAVEVVHAVDEALAIVAAYAPFDPPAAEATPRAATGFGASEAPRGLLYHRYRLAADGTIEDAEIVPPTSQNQGTIEDDLRELVTANLDLDDEALQWRCEQSIRN